MRRALFVFGILNDSDIEWMIAAGSRRSLPASQILIQAGIPADSLFLVMEGRFGVFEGGPGNRAIAQLRSGEIVGEISFVDRLPPTATVKAMENSVVLELPSAVLRARLASDAPFSARFYKSLTVLLSDRLRSTLALFGTYQNTALDDEFDSSGEIGAETLETLSLASARFDLLKRRLRAI